MAFNKIQPEQIQLATFFSSSGDISISQTDTGVGLNLSRDIVGDFAISSLTGSIGRLNWHSGHYIAGNIDEVAIWDTNLSSADITAIYNSGVPNNLMSSASYDTDRTGNLVGYWRFEEGTGTSVADSSDNSNTGTLVNTPTWDTDVPS